MIGETVKGVKVEDVAAILDNKYINFKIACKENKKVVNIGVSVCQQSGGSSVQAALKQLLDYKKFDLTRGCLVRSKRINPNAKSAHSYLEQLLKKQGGEWVLLQSEDIKPLLAISFVYCGREGYELSEEEIFDYIKHKGIAINNPLIREILSDPSGQIPENAVDEDLPTNIPRMTNVSDSADLLALDVIAH